MGEGRRLVAVAAGTTALTDAVQAALDGTGPAVLALPDEPAEADRIRAALRPDQPLEDDDIAVVIATSGSTGPPKGVLLSAAALLASAAAAHDRLGGTGRWLLALPTTHIAGLQVLIRSLVGGSPPVALPDGRSPDPFVAGTRELGAGTRYTSLVPTQLRRLLAAGPEVVEALRSYEAVLLGGAAATSGLLADARGAGVRVITTYGMSETSGGCVYDGSPLNGVTIRLTEHNRIELAGPVLARGYRLRPDLTAAHFRDGLFLTSDAGTFDDTGRLVVLGRSDDLIVTGGEKVAPGAVEAALAEHPSVEDVAVAGTADVEWGQRVVAFVVLRPGRHLTLDQARQHVADRVSKVAAPRELREVAALPLLPSGKLDRRAL